MTPQEQRYSQLTIKRLEFASMMETFQQKLAEAYISLEYPDFKFYLNGEFTVRFSDFFADTILDVVEYNVEYFSKVLDVESIGYFRIVSYLLDYIGLTKTGDIVEDGILYLLLKNIEANEKIVLLQSNKLSGSLSKAKLDKLSLEVLTGEDGIINDTLNKFELDLPILVDRFTGSEMSKENGLNDALYDGALLPKSRAFCVLRKGKVFTRKEIARFGTSADTYGGYTNKQSGDFNGKNRINYNPFISLGGYRCVDVLHWITKEEADKRRIN